MREMETGLYTKYIKIWSDLRLLSGTFLYQFLLVVYESSPKLILTKCHLFQVFFCLDVVRSSLEMKALFTLLLENCLGYKIFVSFS